jgi:hypothetical protein
MVREYRVDFRAAGRNTDSSGFGQWPKAVLGINPSMEQWLNSNFSSRQKRFKFIVPLKTGNDCYHSM